MPIDKRVVLAAGVIAAAAAGCSTGQDQVSHTQNDSSAVEQEAQSSPARLGSQEGEVVLAVCDVGEIDVARVATGDTSDLDLVARNDSGEFVVTGDVGDVSNGSVSEQRDGHHVDGHAATIDTQLPDGDGVKLVINGQLVNVTLRNVPDGSLDRTTFAQVAGDALRVDGGVRALDADDTFNTLMTENGEARSGDEVIHEQGFVSATITDKSNGNQCAVVITHARGVTPAPVPTQTPDLEQR